MSKFISKNELGDAIYNIIWEAKTSLMIVSPYIKLDDYFKKLFNKHLSNPKIHITIIFGKNEGQVSKSFHNSDLEYFKQFLNVSIVYVPNLHAKYYANQDMGVITSINLYDYSFKNNIEFGVLYENNLLSRLSKSTDDEVWESCKEMADENEVIYIKRPVFEKKLLGKNYINSRVLCDKTYELYRGENLRNGKKLTEYEEELNFNIEPGNRPTREEVEKPSITSKTEIPPKQTFSQIQGPASGAAPTKGYCIRTGVEIPYNPERPMSYQAYQSWSKFGNDEYPENYCHFSGEPSKGETSVRRPILYKNWKQAKSIAWN